MIRRPNQSRTKTSFRQKLALLLLGVFLCFAFLEIALRLGGFVLVSLQERRNIASLKRQAEIRILCLGESTTTGTYSASGANSYPSQLEAMLNSRNLGMKFSVINRGVVGTDTTRILGQLDEDYNKYKPQIVITMMGANDEGEHLPRVSGATAGAKSLLMNMRTYKLIALLGLHIKTKFGAYLTSSKGLKQAQAELGKEDESLPIKRYVLLAEYYKTQGQYEKAEELFKKAIEFGSVSYVPYVNLGWCYRKQGKLDEAEAMFKKAIELHPKNDAGYAGLGRCYKDRGMEKEADAMFRKAIEMNSLDGGIFQGLAWYIRKDATKDQHEDIYRRGMELNPIHYRSYGALALYYQQLGKEKLAEEYYEKANELRLMYYNKITTQNYRTLKKKLDEWGVQLVCVQYPNRSIEPLKKMLEGETGGVIFVDNEKTFRRALSNTDIREYFMDVFGGDFGHCTIKGNKLLAENIADVLIQECFDRKR